MRKARPKTRRWFRIDDVHFGRVDYRCTKVLTKAAIHKAGKIRASSRHQTTDHGTFEFAMKLPARATRNRRPRDGFIERHIGMAVTTNPFLSPECFGKSLTQSDAHVFHRMMRVDINPLWRESLNRINP